MQTSRKIGMQSCISKVFNYGGWAKPSQNNCISGGFIVTVSTSKKELDKKWIDLILEARNSGISIEEIKEFLKNTSKT